jgi:hypothetical protein
MFYDHNLTPLPEYTTIQWQEGTFNSFSKTGKYSQLIYFLPPQIVDNKMLSGWLAII